MFKTWYNCAKEAVMVKYGTTTIEMLDRENNTERTKLLEQLSKTGFKDGGNWVTPYFDEKLWSDLLVIGTVIDVSNN
jgi:hypothetical protein